MGRPWAFRGALGTRLGNPWPLLGPSGGARGAFMGHFLGHTCPHLVAMLNKLAPNRNACAHPAKSSARSKIYVFRTFAVQVQSLRAFRQARDEEERTLLVCWFVGLLVCWFVGLLVCWFVGLLVCWFVGLLCFVFVLFLFLFCCFDVCEWSQMVQHGSQIGPKWPTNGSQRCPNKSQRGPKGSQRGPKGVPKGSQRGPKGVPKGVPKGWMVPNGKNGSQGGAGTPNPARSTSGL